MKYSAIAAGVILSTLGFSGAAHAEDDAFITALKAGKPMLDLRLRHEEVESDGAAEDAMEDKADAVDAAGEAKAEALEEKAEKVEDQN